MSALRDANGRLFGGPFGAACSFYIDRPRFARVIAGLVWGGDIRPTYELLGVVGRLADGSTVVDAPCGTGGALRQRLLVRPSTGAFGPTGSSTDLANWLGEAGLATDRFEVSGPFAYFDARRPSV